VTTKKLFIVIGGIVAGAVLLIAIFVGLIVGLAFYSVSHSQAAETARNFLRTNEKLKQEIGAVNDFGTFVTGSVNSQGAEGEATLYLKVIGEKKTVNAKVDLMYQSGRAWRVTDASYENDAGHNVELLEQYEPSPPDVK
jgi:hypothetical protein